MSQDLLFQPKCTYDCRKGFLFISALPLLLATANSATFFLFPSLNFRFLLVGNEIERAIYKGMTLTGLVQRLLTKRCVAFLGPSDNYLLLSGHQGCGGFHDIGTAAERGELCLKNVLSYDEIKVCKTLTIKTELNSKFNYCLFAALCLALRLIAH